MNGEQVKSAPLTDLEAFQRYQRGEGMMHPFTCGNDHRAKPDPPYGFAPLTYQVELEPVEEDGKVYLICPEGCGWRQDARPWIPMVRGSLETARQIKEYRSRMAEVTDER